MSIKRNDIFFCVGKLLRHKNSDEVLSWVNEKMCLKKASPVDLSATGRTGVFFGVNQYTKSQSKPTGRPK